MAIDLGKHAEKLNEGEEAFRGGDYPPPGKYRFIIQDAEILDSGLPNERWRLSLEVVAGNPSGYEQKELGLQFFTTDGQYEGNEARLLLLCMATGIVTIEQLQALQRQGKGYEPDLTAAHGKEFCAELSKQEGKDFLRVKGKRIWSVTDDAAKDIPGCGPGAETNGSSGGGSGKSDAYAGAF